MSANPPTLLAPVSDHDLDADLGRVASAVMDESTMIAQVSNWALQILTPENLAAGLLIVLGGPEPRPMTQEEFDTYRLFFGQADAIARMWTEGSPPATGLVQPWWREYRTT